MSGLIGRIITSWRAAKAEQAGTERTDREAGDLEFLPAAIEILETPASPVGRGLAVFIAVVFTAAILWSVFGRIDTVAVGTGRLVPDGKVKLVQPIELATVRQIHVREGQQVSAGEVLVELDDTESEAERDQVARELLEARLDVSRLAATLAAMEKRDGGDAADAAGDGYRNDAAGFDGPPDAPPSLVRLARNQMAGTLERFRTELAAYQGELNRIAAARQAIQAEIKKLRTLIPLIEEREQGLGSLASKGFAARPQWLEVKQQLVTFTEDLSIMRQRLLESDAERDKVLRQMEQARAAAIEQVLDDLLQARNRMDQAALGLKKANRRQEVNTLLAPVSGRVQQLAVNTVGGVVSPAEPIMMIVPDESVLHVEARILNKDIGFIEPGQTARVKLDSFPYTKYGIVDGRVTRLSADAIEDERLGLVYLAEIALDTDRVLVGDRFVQLAPGMSTTVEISTGDRAIIEYFLSPLQRYQDEALREK